MEWRWGVVARPGELEDLAPRVTFSQKTRTELQSAPIQPHMAKGRPSRHEIAQRSVARTLQMSSPTVIWAWQLFPE